MVRVGLRVRVRVGLRVRVRVRVRVQVRVWVRVRDRRGWSTLGSPGGRRGPVPGTSAWRVVSSEV